MASSSCTGSKSDEEEEEMSCFKKDALSVVTFRVVYDKMNVEKNKYPEFKPIMAHQIFGDSESIFGYRSLSINLYYLHNSARCYVDLQASGEIKGGLNQPDDIMKSLDQYLPENYTTEKNEFLKMIENEIHDTIFGTVLNEFKDTKKNEIIPSQEEYAKYKITLCDTKDEKFQQFHSRFETFITWFIDGANFIDLTDERWMIFYAFEEVFHPETGKPYITPVGYCTVYKFLAYPNKIRARISQFFVLPSHQKRGIGTSLYQTVFKHIQGIADVVDITVEEPTLTFQRIRDVDDCSIIYNKLKETGISLTNNNLKKIFNIIKTNKICRKQCLRIYDILRAYEASQNVDNYKSFLACIKERIRSENEKETRGSKKRQNILGAATNLDVTEKNALIEANYKKYIEDIEQSMKNFRKKLKITIE
nr:histone acetyltransferase type B catalytic subunit [Leptinotarsa decemlineata]XP_023029652.1 histone acetyltransferase type B catalytic subunit [Leptinotarsa decemlineata]